jgi:Tfp pilus assembly protein PilP
MSRSTRLLPLVALCGWLIGTSAVAAQSAPPAEAPATGELVPTETPGLSEISELLQGEDAVLSGEGVTYDPEERRDPFKSLLVANEQTEQKRVRPPGIPGLMIDELQITGIFRKAGGFLAQVQSANKERSYLLKPGDQLFDGDVVSISPNQVVFKQIVQDPTALKPFREVVKTLRPEGS